MSYRTLYFRRDDNTKVGRYFIFDTAAELLTATLVIGDIAYAVNTKVFYVADTPTSFSAINSAGTPGSVTTVSVVTANGVSGSVANPTTTPAITLTLGAIAPTSVAASGTVSGSNLSGTNTGDQTNISGNAATVTTNANLTGPITSVGNATSIASQTGTGTKFVVDTSPTLVTPVLGVASATSLSCPSIITASGAIVIAPASGLTDITGDIRGSGNFSTSAGDLYTDNGRIISTSTGGQSKVIQAITGTGKVGFYHTDGTRKWDTYVDSTGVWMGTESNNNFLIFTNNNNQQWQWNTDGSSWITLDSGSGGFLYFGAGGDCTIGYDGTDMLINPKVVGTGILKVSGTLRPTAYQSSDTSPGITTTITSALLVGKTITVKDGLITGFA